MQSVLEPQTVQKEDGHETGGEAESPAEDGLPEQIARRVPPDAALRHRDLGQNQRQEHGDGIVRPRLHLEDRSHSRSQLQAAGLEKEEHGGCVRGGDDRPHQEALDPAEVEDVVSEGSHQSGRDGDPRDASVTLGASASLMAERRVRKPPSNRMTASAQEPMR